MKSSMIVVTGLLGLLLGSFTWYGDVDATVTNSSLLSEPSQSIDQISGTWHAFPAGLLLQIDGDGSTQFGQDLDGTPIGYRGEMRFSNQQVYVQFTDYSGSEEPCESAIGSYKVRIHESGAIHFELIHDDCLFRGQLLAGEPNVEMFFHRVGEN